jgi:hypothetical protein
MSVPLEGHQPEGHRRIDERSVALHRFSYRRETGSTPELLEIARDNLNRWYAGAGRSRPYLDQWKLILERPLEEMLSLIVREDEAMTALRQSSPFAGILNPKERWAIYSRFERPGDTNRHVWQSDRLPVAAG